MKIIRPLFSNIKDIEDINNKSNIVYQIKCMDCPKNYVGQTSPTLCKRIQKHSLTCL